MPNQRKNRGPERTPPGRPEPSEPITPDVPGRPPQRGKHPGRPEPVEGTSREPRRGGDTSPGGLAPPDSGGGLGGGSSSGGASTSDGASDVEA